MTPSYFHRTYFLTAHYACWHEGQQRKSSTPVCSGPASRWYPRCGLGSSSHPHVSWSWIWCSALPSSCHWLPAAFHHCHSSEYLLITVEAHFIQFFFVPSVAVFVTKDLLRNWIVSPVLKHQPGQPVDHFSSELYASTCLAWVTLPGAKLPPA